MNKRVTIILGVVIFIGVLLAADRVLKMQNRGTLSVPSNDEISNTKTENTNYKSGSNVIEVSENNFENEVLKSDKKVLIVFYATWCGPCKMLSPIVDEVSSERNDVKFVRIDVDKAKKLAAKYSIYSIPTLIIIENGEEVDRQVGLINKEQLIEFVLYHKK